MGNQKNDRIIEPDAAALIHPYRTRHDWCQMYRFWVDTARDVDKTALEEAVNGIRDRFPTFFVKLHRGYDNYKFEPAEAWVRVEEDTPVFCRKLDMSRGTDRPLFRLTCTKRRIALEMFHGITDGHGFIVFFDTLLAEYCRRTGIDIPCGGSVLDPAGEPTDEEAEDAFRRYYTNGPRANYNGKKAAQWDKKRQKDLFIMSFADMDAAAVHALAKSMGVSITLLLTAAYSLAFCRLLDDKQKEDPIKILCPIDMRSLYPSQTLRNFIQRTTLDIDPKEREWDIGAILEKIAPQLKAARTKEYLQPILDNTVHDESAAILGYIPYFMKIPTLSIGADLFGERLFTSTMSNLGVIDMPPVLAEQFTGYHAVIGETRINTINAVITTFRGGLCVNFSTVVNDQSVQREFCEILRGLGLDVKYTCDI